MPAVFQIVSRSSGKALRHDEDSFVDQFTQDAQNPAQMWVLTPQDTANDLLIHPFGSPELGIGVTQQPNDPRLFLGLQASMWSG
jgi:hypothetical protein